VHLWFAVILLIVPKEDRRRFMMKAYELGMTKGEYVFYTIEMLPEENVLNPEDVWANDDGQNVVAKEAFEAVFHVRHIKKSYHIRYVIGIEPNENLSV